MTRTGRRCAAGLLAVAALFPVSDSAVAQSSILDLGNPTNAVSPNPYFPVDTFGRARNSPSTGSPLRIVFFSGPFAMPSAAASWPLVKALEQFGTLIGVQPDPARCFTVIPDPAHGIPPASGPFCLIPGFDLAHARIRSRWISLAFRNLGDETGHCSAAHLSASDWSFFVRYSHSTIHSKSRFCAVVNSTTQIAPLRVSTPLLVIGNYAAAGSQILHPGDFEEPLAPVTGSTEPGPQSGLSFDTIQADLAAGQDPPNTSLVEDVNAETNIITAFICKSDGMRPKSACGRSVIKSILKHVK